MIRHRLANRRAHETIAFEHHDMPFTIGLGREVACNASCGAKARLGPIVEVFLDTEKVNSFLDVLVKDGAILMSLLLQHGCAIETINHAMKRNPDGSPSSPLGRAAALIAAAGEMR
jgi:hypothetical protein